MDRRLVFACCTTVLLMIAYSRVNYGLRKTKVKGKVTEEEMHWAIAQQSSKIAVHSATTTTTARTITTKESRCSPARKIVFVKTHKTAGTSVALMIFDHYKRLGQGTRKQELFPLPFIGGYPGHFDSRFLISSDGKSIGSLDYKPDIVAGHLRYNGSAFEKLMPPETRYITILRNPTDVFLSSFYYYYGSIRRVRVDKKGLTCINSPYMDILGRFNASLSEYLRIAPSRLNPTVPWYFRSMNYQAHDLGLDPSRSDPEYISEQIRKLESSFSLVMIAEYFLESLILLRQELCMDWSSLTAAIRNKGRYEKPEFSAYEKSAMRNLNRLDYELYAHFNRTLWKKIRAYGVERMAADVKKIRRTPTYEQLKILQHLDSDYKEIRQHEGSIFDDVDVSNYFKGNAAARLSQKLANQKFSRFTSLSASDEKLRRLADYMIASSGGCSL